MKYAILPGQKFKRLVVLCEFPRHKGKLSFWCQCDCGMLLRVRKQSLVSGHTRSCGCYQKDLVSKSTSERNYKHGHSIRTSTSPEYNSWLNMMRRCNDPDHERYQDWGGRGIIVCERWFSFENFFEDMGPKPDKSFMIERVDNDGNYEPSNCIWATNTVQARNRRSNHLLTVDGQTRTLTEWSEISGIKQHTIRKRVVDLGWNTEDAIFTPVLM